MFAVLGSVRRTVQAMVCVIQTRPLVTVTRTIWESTVRWRNVLITALETVSANQGNVCVKRDIKVSSLRKFGPRQLISESVFIYRTR